MMRYLQAFVSATALLLLAATSVGAVDDDLDGLDTADEIALGLDPDNADSDCDGLGDGTEVGNPAAPNDGDGDGVIDARESAERDTNLDGVLDELDTDAASVWRVGCARFSPGVVTTDATEPATVEVSLAGGTGVSSVELGNSFPVVGVTIGGAPFPQSGGFFDLFDDGSNGDRVAGDGIWTRANIRIDAIPLPAIFMLDFDQLRVTDISSTLTRSLWQTAGGGAAGGARLGRLDPALRASAADQGDGFRATTHIANLVDPLALIEAQRYLMLRPPTSTIRADVMRFYAVFGDRFDFLLLQPAQPSVRGAAGLHAGVRNQVSGIGKTIFDHGATWGSAARLQSAIVFNLSQAGPYVHEITHRWSQSLSAALGFGQCQGGHWGLVGVGLGPVGGFDPAGLVNNGDGSWTLPLAGYSLAGPGSDTVAMNPMDLYLAGLIPTSQVPSFPAPVNADCGMTSFNFPAGEVTFVADNVVTRTIGQVTATHGARDPSVATSQKNFTAGWLVFSAAPLNPTELGFFEYQANYLGLPDGPLSFRLSFEEATGGRATLDTRIVADDLVFLNGFED